MNQLMKNLRLPVTLATTVGLNAGGVDAAKIEQTFGDKSQPGAQASLVTGEEARQLGGDLAGNVKGMQMAQLRGNTALLNDISNAASRLHGTNIIDLNRPGYANVGQCVETSANAPVRINGDSGYDISARIVRVNNAAPFFALEFIAHDGCDFKGSVWASLDDNGLVSFANSDGAFALFKDQQIINAINQGLRQ